MKITNFTDSFTVTDDLRKQFEEDGFVIIRNVMTSDELGKMINFFQNSNELKLNASGKGDGASRQILTSSWNYALDDVSGLVARSEKIAGVMEQLMGGDEIYHYHSKVIMKDAMVGGALVWHQDYGYWYKNGILAPDMGAVFIALDKCTRENGCLKVLPGSQKMGRIDHLLIGDGFKQNMADPERVKWAKERLPEVYCELEPGDAIYFHCNLLHSSDQNSSKHRRWSFIVSYNKKSNDPVIDHHHSRYIPLEKVPNDAIMKCQVAEFSEKMWWVDATKNKSIM